METATIFFNTNLKYLRSRQNLSQEELGAKLNLSRVKLNALENGHTKSPLPQDYITISNFFKISIDSLMRVDLTKLGELKIRELEAGNDVYIKGGNFRVLAITIDKSNKEHVEYVPVKAKAGYMSGYSDPDFIAQLQKFSQPNLPKNGTFRIFATSGDSMLPIPEGSDVTARFVQDWNTLKPDTMCIVVLDGQQDIVFKMLTLQADGTVQLKSLNPAYAPYTVPVEEIREVWKFHSFTSSSLPRESSSEMAYVTKTLAELKSHLIR